MIKILKYNEDYNILHPKFHSLKLEEYCTIGEIDGSWLVLEKDQEIDGYNRLVHLCIIEKYEHNGEKCKVEETGWNKYRITRIY